ncbi:MAG: PHP domain-containing protein [Candidatus Melainabacteria bacterium]|nr:PHP domain-containing protein [Candidatus Melainabacteria bacterium]
MKIDLHLHSTHSDGNWTPSQLVAHAINIGMDTIALTDHDTVSGIDEALASADGKLEVVPALEINTVWTDKSGVSQDVHILGYFIDKENETLLALLKRQQEARNEHVRKLVDILAAEGMKISFQAIHEIADGSPIGKVHVTQAIVSCGGASDVTEAYTKFYDRKSKYYVKRESVSPFEAIEAIRAAGGITSIAHPSYCADLTSLIVDLSKHGLDGIEVYHSAHQPQHEASHLKLAERLNLLITGGSDCHGPWGEHESLMGTIPVPPDVIVKLKQRRF